MPWPAALSGGWQHPLAPTIACPYHLGDEVPFFAVDDAPGPKPATSAVRGICSWCGSSAVVVVQARAVSD